MSSNYEENLRKYKFEKERICSIVYAKSFTLTDFRNLKILFLGEYHYDKRSNCKNIITNEFYNELDLILSELWLNLYVPNNSVYPFSERYNNTTINDAILSKFPTKTIIADNNFSPNSGVEFFSLVNSQSNDKNKIQSIECRSEFYKFCFDEFKLASRPEYTDIEFILFTNIEFILQNYTSKQKHTDEIIPDPFLQIRSNKTRFNRIKSFYCKFYHYFLTNEKQLYISYFQIYNDVLLSKWVGQWVFQNKHINSNYYRNNDYDMVNYFPIPTESHGFLFLKDRPYYNIVKNSNTRIFNLPDDDDELENNITYIDCILYSFKIYFITECISDEIKCILDLFKYNEQAESVKHVLVYAGAVHIYKILLFFFDNLTMEELTMNMDDSYYTLDHIRNVLREFRGTDKVAKIDYRIKTRHSLRLPHTERHTMKKYNKEI